MKTIGGPFGRSPFGPLREHMTKVVECVKLLTLQTEAFLKKKFDETRSLATEISKEEHGADLIKKRIREQLTKSILSSINRSEIMAILKEQDSMADACEEVAVLIAVRPTDLPDELVPFLRKTLEGSRKAVELISKASEKLTEIEEKEPHQIQKEITEILDQVQQQEWDCDDLQRSFLENLFLLERQINPIDAFILMKLIKQIGYIGNHADNTGDCMRRLLS